MSFEFSYNNDVSVSKKRSRDANDEAASAVDPRKRVCSLCTTLSGERTHASSSSTAADLVVRVKCAGRDELPCLEVSLESEATVSTLKESLAIILCSKKKEMSSYPVVPVERQRLIHRGRLLRDDDALLVDDVGMSVDPLGGSDVVHLAPLPENRPSTKTTKTTPPPPVGDVDLLSYEEDVHRANVRSLLLQRQRIMDSVLSSVRATMDTTAVTAATPLFPGLFGSGATTSLPFPVEDYRYGALCGHVWDGVAPLPALATAPAYATPLDLRGATTTTTTTALSPLAALLRPAPSYDPYRADVVGTPLDVLSRRGSPPPRSSLSLEAIVSDGLAAERRASRIAAAAAVLLASRRRAADDDRSLRDARWTPY